MTHLLMVYMAPIQENTGRPKKYDRASLMDMWLQFPAYAQANSSLLDVKQGHYWFSHPRSFLGTKGLVLAESLAATGTGGHCFAAVGLFLQPMNTGQLREPGWAGAHRVVLCSVCGDWSLRWSISQE